MDAHTQVTVNVHDSMNENNKSVGLDTDCILTQFITRERGCRVCVGKQKQQHTHKIHRPVAERITQQIIDPVNYMGPLPEVKVHS